MENVKNFPNSEEWDMAYHKVELYLTSLKIKNRRVVSKLSYMILDKAILKSKIDKTSSPTELAMREAFSMASQWCGKILGIDFGDYGIPVRARLAMLFSELPEKWCIYFLSDEELPPELIKRMRDTYIISGPDFQSSKMIHRALKLNPAGSVLAETFRLAGRRPFFKRLVFILIAIAFVLIFYFTR